MKLAVELLRGQLTIGGKDKHSHLFKHACNENHKHVDLGNRFERKISEALNIKQYKPKLNTQEQSILLKLFD